MTISTVAALVDALRDGSLLDAAQKNELASALQPRFAETESLAAEVVRRGWLTLFQMQMVLKGQGQDLVKGPYTLLDCLGEGGMGQVYKARHLLMNRLVAVKIIRKERQGDERAVHRFRREIKAVSQLSHPNIILALDAAQMGDTLLLAMEYVQGMDLAQLIAKQGPLPVDQACDYIRQAALGLQHAHERGLVHRDIKPHNLLVTEQGGIVKVLDLGLSRLREGVAAIEPSRLLTKEGDIMGTPEYMSPQQALDAHKADIRSDIYSLGCTFYFLLAGRPPFRGKISTEIILKHLHEEPPALDALRSGVPPPVLAIVQRMMTKGVDERYQTPAEVANALAPFCASKPAVPAGTPAVFGLAGLKGAPTGIPSDGATVAAPPGAVSKRFSTRWVLWVGILLLVLLAGFLLIFVLRKD